MSTVDQPAHSAHPSSAVLKTIDGIMATNMSLVLMSIQAESSHTAQRHPHQSSRRHKNVQMSDAIAVKILMMKLILNRIKNSSSVTHASNTSTSMKLDNQ